MSVERTIRLARPAVSPGKLGPFRFGEIAGRVLLTNDAGEWLFLDKPEFAEFLAGRVGPAHPRHPDLLRRGFLAEGVDVEAMAARVRRKKGQLGRGPGVHVLVVTRRCNEAGPACPVSCVAADSAGADMSLETARQAVDLALQSDSPHLEFEFQGGEPTLNFPAVQEAILYCRRSNRVPERTVAFSIVTNLGALTEEMAEWLLENEVRVWTRLEGPQDLHDASHPVPGGRSAHAEVVRWIGYLQRRHRELGRDPRQGPVDAIVTATRPAFGRWREVVDLFLELGLGSVHVRPVDAWRAQPLAEGAEDSIDEYLDFYRRCLDHLVELNLGGTEISEGTASAFLARILGPDAGAAGGVRSRATGAVGTLSYDFDGRIFPSDQARLLRARGDDIFAIGWLGQTAYQQVVRHPTVRALALAAVRDGLPGCHSCWNEPFCGINPVDSYAAAGDIFGQRPLLPDHREHLFVASLLFERLARDGDGRVEAVFRRWVGQRPEPSAG